MTTMTSEAIDPVTAFLVDNIRDLTDEIAEMRNHVDSFEYRAQIEAHETIVQWLGSKLIEGVDQ